MKKIIGSMFILGILVSCAGTVDMARVSPMPAGCKRPTLPYLVAFEDGTDEYRELVFETAARWESETDLLVVQHARAEERPTLVIRRDDPTGRRHDMAVWKEKYPDGTCYAVMNFTEPHDSVSSYWLVLHEWGHVLGLRDSSNDRSVMNPVIEGLMTNEETGYEATEKPFPVIMPDDIATVKAINRSR